MIFSKDNLLKLKRALLNLGETATNEGLLIYDGENLEVGVEVFVEGEDGLTPAPDKDYIYDEKTVRVEGGIVTSIVENKIEQPVEEVVEEVEEVVETSEETLEETVEEETEETTETVEEEVVEGPSVDELNSIIEEQKAMIEDLKAQIEELKKKLEEPAAEPAEDEFKNQPKKENKKVDFSKYIKRK